MKFSIIRHHISTVYQNPNLINRLRNHLVLNDSSGISDEFRRLDKIDRDLLQTYAYCLYEKNTKNYSNIVSWAMFSNGPSDYWRFQACKETDWWIMIYTHPLYRRQGLGSAIIRRVFKDAGDIQIGIAPSNPTNRGFFKTFLDKGIKLNSGFYR